MANKILMITDQAQLPELLTDLSSQEVIAIDTEFVRRQTYFAQLALVQIATRKKIYIVDAFKIDATILKPILEDVKILKLFHAPQQDLEIFYHQYGIFTRPIFDTQFAAQLSGTRSQIGFQALCEKLLNLHIDKTLQDQNWAIRPLPQEMINYAAQDAELLLPLYDKLLSELQAYHNYDKCMKMMASFSKKEYYQLNHSDLWKKIKFSDHSPVFIEKMQMITAFREQVAMRLNLPRQHVISNDDIIILAQKLPTTQSSFNNLKINHKLSSDEILELCDLCLGLREGI